MMTRQFERDIRAWCEQQFEEFNIPKEQRDALYKRIRKHEFGCTVTAIRIALKKQLK